MESFALTTTDWLMSFKSVYPESTLVYDLSYTFNYTLDISSCTPTHSLKLLDLKSNHYPLSPSLVKVPVTIVPIFINSFITCSHLSQNLHLILNSSILP